MNVLSRIAAGTVASALVVAGTLAAGGSASARDDRPEILKSGDCTAGSDWKLKVKKDDGRVDVEFEVDQNRNGDTWHVVLRNDGVKFFEADRKTMPPSGSFEVDRRSNDGAGPDRILARARNLRTGEVCVGAATLPG